ncbi:MAG TPA: tetratricopeptide repeat protein [Myxococcales bacterium]|nr:tetratricopeptide repeat protein [Myxococcales bacterium]
MTAVALSLLLAAAPSFARTHARELYQSGAKAYTLGDFAAALADFDKAYEYDAAPGLLFNLGQCHHQLRHWEKAEFFFKRYLEALPGARNAALVRELVQQDEAHLAPPAAPRASPPPAVPVVVVMDQPPAPKAPPTPAAASKGPPPAPPAPAAALTSEAPRPRRHVAPWLVGGVGVACLATGGVLGGLALSNGDQTRAAVEAGHVLTQHSDTYAQANQANAQATAGLAVGSVGVTLVVAAVVWVLTARP